MNPGALLRVSAIAMLACVLAAAPARSQDRPRPRSVGAAPGILPPGPFNAITDVPGVLVGQTTLRVGDSIRTGVTAILPHGGNLYQDRVPAAVHVINGFGKLLGTTQLSELGELETPILLTCTLCVWKAADALTAYLLAQPGMGEVRSINPVVGETNDGYLNAIRSRPITAQDVVAALTSARTGPVAEGSVGAGTGTITLGWKGGIGTSSRRISMGDSSWMVGVLVQTNFGGSRDLILMGVPVGRLLGRDGVTGGARSQGVKGSIMIVVATDAPLSDRNLERLAARAALGLGRTGAIAGNGSGDYVLAFSTNLAVRRAANSALRHTAELANDAMSPLFAGVVEATEEAIDNALFAATTTSANGNTVEALPIDDVLRLLRERGALAAPLAAPSARP
jgi:D-aminopeptidase